MIGKQSLTEFHKLNAEAGSKVKAIEISQAELSPKDAKIMRELAKESMMQLELSRVAVAKAETPAVKTLAEAEVSEQSTMGKKLKELADAAKVELPAQADDKAQRMVEKLQGTAGAEMEKMYLRASGVEGHEKLQKLMEEVKSEATHSTLKQIAETALPLIRSHLAAAQALAGDHPNH